MNQDLIGQAKELVDDQTLLAGKIMPSTPQVLASTHA